MWSRSKSEAAKRFAPILEKETANTSAMEWFRYTETIHQITTLITGFELTNEQAKELKRKMSGETYSQLSCDSVCQLQALNVRTDQWCTVTLIEKSEDRLILDWTHSTDCQVGKMTLISVIASGRMMITPDVIESSMQRDSLVTRSVNHTTIN